jgi:hypothetical protein
MLHSITWSQYITATIILLLAYYAFVAFKYYRWEILSLAGIKKINTDDNGIPAADLKKQFTSSNNADYLPKGENETDISPIVQAFKDEVLAYINEAAIVTPKEELLYALQIIAAKYPVLKNADCKDEIVAMVFNAANNKYPNLITPEDMSRLWL